MTGLAKGAPYIVLMIVLFIPMVVIASLVPQTVTSEPPAWIVIYALAVPVIMLVVALRGRYKRARG